MSDGLHSEIILISHRGNTNGKFESYENEPNYIDLALSKGYDVEIDIWYVDGLLYLGHDKPQYGIDFRWIRDRINRLWVHCKNVDAVIYFKDSGYDVCTTSMSNYAFDIIIDVEFYYLHFGVSRLKVFGFLPP